jgi:hypothetical protein
VVCLADEGLASSAGCFQTQNICRRMEKVSNRQRLLGRKMKQIWKFHLYPNSNTHRTVPKGFRPLSVGVQGTELCVWGVVDPKQRDTETRLFWAVGTGQDIDNNEFIKCDFIGTVQQGPFVWHVFMNRIPV